MRRKMYSMEPRMTDRTAEPMPGPAAERRDVRSARDSERPTTVTHGQSWSLDGGRRESAQSAFALVRALEPSLNPVRTSRLGLTWPDGVGLAGCPQVKRAVPTFALAA